MVAHPRACDDGGTMTQYTHASRPGQPRRAFRDTSAPLVGGVAAGLAAHLAVPVLWVRVFFVATAFLGGFGLMLYGGLWLFMPADPARPGWRARRAPASVPVAGRD
jgi:phage shock protein PspC (stress-responsive transcriptional regulator)